MLAELDGLIVQRRLHKAAAAEMKIECKFTTLELQAAVWAEYVCCESMIHNFMLICKGERVRGE